MAQWQYLAFCLSQLPPYNEKCLKKLQDNLDKLADKLGDKEVYEHFLTILNAAKKGAKLEAKVSDIFIIVEPKKTKVGQL